MGLLGAAIGLGFVVGPAMGGLLAPLGPAIPFWVAMLVAIANALLLLRFLPETRRWESACATVPFTNRGMGGVLAGWRWVLRNPAVARLVVINLLFTVAFTAMEAVFPLFTQHSSSWKAIQNGYIFTYAGIVIVLMQGGLFGRLVKRWGECSLLIAGLVMLAAGLTLLSWRTNLALLLVALGLAQGVAGLGQVIGPLAAGSIFAIGGPGAPFILGSALVVLAALIALPTLLSKRQVALTHSTPDIQLVSTVQDGCS